MIYGFVDGKFYVDLVSCSRSYLNLREEYKLRSLEIFNSTNNPILSFSGGLDSQAVLHSFLELGINIKTVFLYLPNYNDEELEQIRILDKKYNIKTEIIDIDPYQCKKEINDLSSELDIPGKNHLLQRKFLSMLPEDCDLIQAMPEPFIYINPLSQNKYYYQGYYTAEISRQRALDSLNRSGKNILFGDSPELQASILNDDVFEAAIVTSEYFDNNKLVAQGKNLLTLDRYDYYIKPLIYGKYWKDELIYFPKFTGFENIDFLNEKTKKIKKHAIVIPYREAKDFISQTGRVQKRFFENVPYENSDKILTVEKDQSGNTVVIRYTENYCEESTYEFFLTELENLKNSGHRIEKSIGAGGSAVYAEINNEIVGIVAYNTNSRKTENLIWLVLGAVKKEYQKNGIYRMMRNQFEIICKAQGFDGVASHIHVDNQVALQSAQNLGASSIYNYMVKWFD